MGNLSPSTGPDDHIPSTGFTMLIFCIRVAVPIVFLLHSPTIFAAEPAETLSNGLQYVAKAGVRWIEKRGCVSCHQVPTLIWSHQSAMRSGLEIDTDQLQKWQDWSIQVVNFVKPDQKADVDVDKTLVGNIDTMTQMLLAIPQRAEAESWRSRFAEALATNQNKDGSWNACGQLPSGKRPKLETTATTTLWTAYALNIEEQKFDLQATKKFTAQVTAPKSTEFVAIQILLSQQLDELDSTDWQEALLSHQNADGGWGWLLDDESDALGTGFALYALAKSNGSTSARRNAIEYLVTTQEKNGRWRVPGTKTSAKGKPTSTAIDWGSAWAIIALSENRDLLE